MKSSNPNSDAHTITCFGFLNLGDNFHVLEKTTGQTSYKPWRLLVGDGEGAERGRGFKSTGRCGTGGCQAEEEGATVTEKVQRPGKAA